jgi:hypothetical protein
MQVIVTEVTEGLRSAVANRADLISNPMNIVGVGMQLMNKYPTLSGTEKKNLLIKGLTSLASGKDGILGTADDAIPKPVVDTITTLIQGNLINDIIGLLVDTSKGRFDIAKAVEVATETKNVFASCFSFLMAKRAPVKSLKSKK